jgi:glutamate-ammonia-ligase adenylyltransferase
VQLFSLFHANPGLLALVAEIMAGAPRLAEHLAQHPALLDSVLTQGFFAPLPELAGLAGELDQAMTGVRDFEDTLDRLRRWAGERRFQVGVQLLRRALDGAQAGTALADIAQTALAALLPRVEVEFARRHGRVPGGSFAVIGMGRLGSREMTLASDLDLILIYDTPPSSETSDGPQPLPIAAYFARLSQRLISSITAPTAEGRLYDVDMRLRPSGEAGPIASHFAGFARYQSESAWTWEHMALTRARPVAGDSSLCRRISEALAAVLRSPRDPEKLVIDVAAMRRRIAEDNPRPSPWDLRNRRGGLIDLEFIVQYLVLRHAAASPQILRRGTAEAVAALDEAGLLPPGAQHELGEAAALFRNVQAVLTLLGDGSPSSPVLAEPDAAALAVCVDAVDFARLDADITAAAARVSGWYDRLVEQPARQAAQARGDDAR